MMSTDFSMTNFIPLSSILFLYVPRSKDLINTVSVSISKPNLKLNFDLT